MSTDLFCFQVVTSALMQVNYTDKVTQFTFLFIYFLFFEFFQEIYFIFHIFSSILHFMVLTIIMA